MSNILNNTFIENGTFINAHIAKNENSVIINNDSSNDSSNDSDILATLETPIYIEKYKDVREKCIRKGKRANKRNRDLKYKRHLKSLNDNFSGWWFPPVYQKQNEDSNQKYYKRLYIGNSYFKRQSNKAVRRYKGDISNGCNYKRCYDYWDTII